jgi:hypothetical protein
MGQNLNGGSVSSNASSVGVNVSGVSGGFTGGVNGGVNGGGGPQSVSNLFPGTILMTQNNQMLIINENGVPVPYDPATGTPIIGASAPTPQQSVDNKMLVGCSSALSSMPPNSLLGTQMPMFDQQQQALISSGALTLGKGDHSGGSLSVSQAQAGILSGLGSQMAAAAAAAGGGMNFLGPQFLTQNALGPLAAVAGGNQGGGGFLTNQQQFLQSLGMQFPGMIPGKHFRIFLKINFVCVCLIIINMHSTHLEFFFYKVCILGLEKSRLYYSVCISIYMQSVYRYLLK